MAQNYNKFLYYSPFYTPLLTISILETLNAFIGYSSFDINTQHFHYQFIH